MSAGLTGHVPGCVSHDGISACSCGFANPGDPTDEELERIADEAAERLPLNRHEGRVLARRRAIYEAGKLRSKQAEAERDQARERILELEDRCAELAERCGLRP